MFLRSQPTARPGFGKEGDCDYIGTIQSHYKRSHFVADLLLILVQLEPASIETEEKKDTLATLRYLLTGPDFSGPPRPRGG
ncbi:peptidase M16 domain-containing protein [Anopheles sinensis]|uniref:Peptidase M16 domain-containing protein n=1 Tax=Anopheles sinensis TaxID=74873 RepID=A0A084WDU0_ANOSI|nr:peptidase M16 domain-containing protein [Anopheles sinensis]